METQFNEKIEMLNEKRNAEVHELKSQNSAQEKKLTELREGRKSEAERFKNIITDKDRLLKAAEKKREELAERLEQLRSELELSKSAREKDCTTLQTTISTSDHTIRDLTLQLEEGKRGEIQLRKEKDELRMERDELCKKMDEWNSKWLSTGSDGDEMERELRETKKRNESLCNELKVDLHSLKELTLVDDKAFTGREKRDTKAASSSGSDFGAQGFGNRTHG